MINGPWKKSNKFALSMIDTMEKGQQNLHIKTLLSTSFRINAFLTTLNKQSLMASDEQIVKFLQQAALLLGKLVHKPAANRLVELLDSPRPEVMIGSAWGLRKLAEPATIPGILDKIRRQTAERRTRPIPGIDEQVAQQQERDHQGDKSPEGPPQAAPGRKRGAHEEAPSPAPR